MDSIKSSASISGSISAPLPSKRSIIGTPGEKWRKLKDLDPRIVSGDSNSLEESYGIAIASTIPVVKWHRLDLKNSVIEDLESKGIYLDKDNSNALLKKIVIE